MCTEFKVGREPREVQEGTRLRNLTHLCFFTKSKDNVKSNEFLNGIVHSGVEVVQLKDFKNNCFFGCREPVRRCQHAKCGAAEQRGQWRWQWHSAVGGWGPGSSRSSRLPESELPEVFWNRTHHPFPLVYRVRLRVLPMHQVDHPRSSFGF